MQQRRYAPISLPEKIDVLPPYGPPVAFNDAAVRQALAQADRDAKSLSRDSDLEQQRRVEQQCRVLTDTLRLVALASAQPNVPIFSSSSWIPCGGAALPILCGWPLS